MDYRWENGDKYIVVEDGTSTDGSSIVVVGTNVWEEVPIGWKEQFPLSEGPRLVESVRQWTEKNGYHPVPPSDDIQ